MSRCSSGDDAWLAATRADIAAINAYTAAYTASYEQLAGLDQLFIAV